MAWCWPGNNPLSEPMMVRLLRHICVIRPQWVKMLCYLQSNAHYSLYLKRHGTITVYMQSSQFKTFPHLLDSCKLVRQLLHNKIVPRTSTTTMMTLALDLFSIYYLRPCENSLSQWEKTLLSLAKTIFTWPKTIDRKQALLCHMKNTDY